MKTPIDNADMYMNLAGLNALKFKAQKPDQKTMKEVAHQFEALFLQTLLKEMRESTQTLGKGLFDSDTLKSYQSMYDQQLALDVSKKGTGLSDLILKQLDAQKILK